MQLGSRIWLAASTFGEAASSKCGPHALSLAAWLGLWGGSRVVNMYGTHVQRVAALQESVCLR